MSRILAATLLLAGCTVAGNPPNHPLVGIWQGTKRLTLKTTEYRFGRETGYWTADHKEFRYKTGSGRNESCDFSVRGRMLVLRGCRLAGRYTRM